MTKFVPSVILLLTLLLPVHAHGQQFFRVKADFSIKEKYPDDSYQLILGTVFYDKHTNKLVYDIHFPHKEKWVLADTLLYKFIADTLQQKELIGNINRFTVFHLALNGNLKNYGLERDGPFEITDIRKEEGLVITTWSPPKKYQEHVGDILLAKKEGRLHGLVIMNGRGEVLSKKFFENYTSLKGLQFPTQLTQINYVALADSDTLAENVATPRKENYKVTQFENVILDETDNDHWYDHPLPR